ncbi:hypothetical protein PROFUN_10765 [Planoprotostelium fungivorum]|uniref:Uncharacterized protein n=1 Tax=Planoprotostelium fungivorum TaxID=1890364 RepID=A0A2P6N804_9EUKA|nr:hypothetical protein PROFUN_10765 [Planoprotostelium fungivorum]
MVVIVHKKTEDDQFMIECTCSTINGDITTQIVRLSNGRFRLSRLADEMEKMVELNSSNKEDEDDDKRIREDEGGYSTLNLNDHQKSLLDRAINDVRLFLSKKQVDQKISLTEETIEQQVSSIRTVLTIMNPAGFSTDHILSKVMRNDASDLEGRKEVYDERTATLWWSNKELLRDQKIGDFIGRNEKTKIMVKLAKSGSSGPPARDNTETQQQKEMLAYYYKKQQEHQKMETDSDDSYLNSAWADPKQLKTAFNGLSNINWKAR